MRDAYTLPELLRRSLSQFWSDVASLDPDHCRELLRSFARDCVRQDLVRKFLDSFNRKPITPRFFGSVVECDIHATVDQAFGSGHSPSVTAEVLWGSFAAPVGFRISGRPTAIDRIFVDEGDAISKVWLASETGYLFLNGATERLLVFRGQR